MGARSLAKRMSFNTAKRDKASKKKGSKKKGSISEERVAVTREAKNITELYNIGQELGAGAFSVVKVGMDKNDESKWALKLVSQKIYKDHKKEIEAEVDILAELEQ